MLTLLQIINYMMVTLEYTPAEVSDAFEKVESGDLSLEGLIGVLGLQVSPTMLQLGKGKLKNWPSALSVTKMRLEE